MDKKFLNVIMLGFGFMFLFTAFQTMGNIEKTILESIANEDSNFNGDGYTSLAIIYAALAICNWLAPSAISICGPRGAMFIGSITYCLFMVSFLYPKTWLLYVASAVLGCGAALIWTGQGSYLSCCSNESNIARNSGVFWAMLQASMLMGNLFVFFQFQGKEQIDANTRHIVFTVLISVAIVGVIFLGLLRRVHHTFDDKERDREFDYDSNSNGIVGAFVKAIKLFFTRNMLLLCITFLYTGFELSFYSGVYGPSIGFTLKIGESAKQLVGLSGIAIGIGEIFGGILFGLLGSKTVKYGRDPIVIIGFIVHMFSFLLIYLNLPDDAPFKGTQEIGYFNPPIVWVALLCSLLLGFGDACFNTQIYSMLGGSFASNSVAAFAVFKFTQSIAAALSFMYSSHLGLHAQMSILLVFGIVGTISFCIVENSFKRDAAGRALNASSKNGADKLQVEVHSD
ncbi:UNC93-like protein MFSD11 [Contarinia nasturtii]|uniref:UNC93-like protein MFSD11 n=1 Tax=Contarinia nasturtii TaxID=265458 RepID=UPI0012D3970C|nr:UNC93-like protein MFSD11 [Contarinia nasturtii]XP_031634203.1 UNC93-like protein MFSD11 [Contarinia nasturtii]